MSAPGSGDYGEEAALDGTQESEQAAGEPEAAPQIAYSYGFDYRLPADRIDQVQQAHVALCDELGTARCRIDAMQRNSGDGSYSSATLALRVEAGIARNFGNRLDAAAEQAGGENSDRAIQAEDLSREIVDTEARIRAKQALTDRLLTIIQNRAGTVGELVEAERAYAQAQQELDSARTWLRQMQGRVAMSTIRISYQSYRPDNGFFAPIGNSLASSGQLLGMSIAAVIGFVVMALPWALLIALIVWGLRRMGGIGPAFRRMFGRKLDETDLEES